MFKIKKLGEIGKSNTNKSKKMKDLFAREDESVKKLGEIGKSNTSKSIKSNTRKEIKKEYKDDPNKLIDHK